MTIGQSVYDTTKHYQLPTPQGFRELYTDVYRLIICSRKGSRKGWIDTMKKLIALFVLFALMLSAAMAEGNEVSPAHMAGGWMPSAEPTVTEELQDLFDKGTETLTGISYIPVAYLGSQVVAGTNHAFLCRAVSAYPGSLDIEPAYAMVYLYEDLSGNVSILSIGDVDIGWLCTY